MPTFRKGRSSIVVLAVLAMVVSMMALPVGAAVVGDVEFPADWSACPAGSVASAGFGDTAGSFAEADIDCIAMYEVTLGTGAGVYSPSAVVTREQMALFLIRAAGPAGITVPAAADQGFTDISGLTQGSQDAINQAAALGFTKGTTATTYSPADPVSRYQMTLFLVRFLEKQNGAADLDDSTVASGFTDTGAVSFEAYNAIETAYDHGITKGTTKTLFSPFAAVTREQMGAFIARTLGHTNARPAGITFQASDSAITAGDAIDVQISVRDASFMPVVDGLVDVFYADLDDKADALKADGTCDTTVVNPQFGGTECTVELAEATATNASGNIDATLTEGADFTGDIIWWAWTGAAGATFDVDTTDVAAAEVTVSAAATHILVTDNLPKTAVAGDANSTGLPAWENGGLAQYGDSVTLTFQLADGADGKAVAKSGVKFSIGYWWDIDNVFQGETIVNLTTDADGKATHTWTFADPSASADNATVVEWYTSVSGTLIWDVNTPAAFGQDYVWEDDAAEATSLALSQSVDYTLASDSGSGAAHTVQATLSDQYGDPVSGQGIEFTSDDLDGIGATAIVRTTNSNGVATLAYARDDATAGIEAVDAEDALTGLITATTMDHYWVLEAPDGYDTAAATAVEVADDANDAIVFIDVTPWVVYYDANDQFKVDGTADSFANFEKAVAAFVVGDAINITDYMDTAAGISQFDWDNL